MKLVSNTGLNFTEGKNINPYRLGINSSTRKYFDKKISSYSINKLINLLEPEISPKILNSMERVNLIDNSYLYRPEEKIKYVYFPETSVISEFQMLEDGKIIETALIGKEGMTKPLSLLNSSHSTNWSQVTLAGTALRIKVQILSEVFNESRLLQKLIFNYLQDSVEQYSNRIMCNTFHLLTERLCNWLLMIQDRIGKNCLSLTHEKVARLLGVYRPNVSVSAKSLQTKNIIKYERGQLTILNRRELENCACVCYSLNKIFN